MARLASLLDWFAQNGIKHDDSAIEIRPDADQYSGDAWGVFARRDVDQGAVLVTIPKAAVLSIRTTGLRAFLEEQRIAGGLGLVLTVMYEAARGPASPWHGYLQSLPAREYIPLFWTPEELALLQGTDAAGKAAEDREDTAADYETEIAPLIAGHPDLFDTAQMSLESFRRAAAYIGSRAFGVDDFHGMAMVPFADIFNHKSSVVALGGDFQVTGACMAVSEASEEASEGAYEQGEGSDAEASEGEAEGQQPAASGGSGSEAAGSDGSSEAGSGADAPLRSRGSLLQSHPFPEQDLRLHIGICSEARDGGEVLEIVAACPLRKGQEVFNTFGELSSSELVCKYGFALPGNPFDCVSVGKQQLLAAAKEQAGAAACAKRAAYLELTSNLLEEGEEAFELLPRGQVGPPLLLAARVLACSGAELRAIQSRDLDGAIERLLPSEQPQAGASAKRRKLAEGQAAEADAAAEGTEAEEAAAATARNAVIAERPDWFPPATCRLLLACIEQREAQHSNTADLAGLRAEIVEARQQLPQGEARTARLAALQLLAAEKEVLAAARAALEGLLSTA